MDTHSLGLYLRDARNARDLTLDDAVSALRIRRGILESFEQGDFNLDASPVQVKGFLRNYASFLGLDEELVISYYEAATSPQRGRRRRRRERPPVPNLPVDSPVGGSRPVSDPSRPATRETLGERRELRRHRRSRLLNTLIGTFLVMVSLLIIGIVAVQFLQGDDELLPQSIVGQPSATVTPTIAPTFTLSAQMASLPEFQQDFDGRGVALTVETQQRTWMRVVVDGAEHLARIVRPGEVLNFRASQEVLVHASNADGLIVFYNGQIQGSYGGRGQEVEVQYLADEINIIKANLPTATPEPTLTPSLTPVETEVLVTDTPQPTWTEAAQPTPSLLPNTGSNGDAAGDTQITEAPEVTTEPVEQQLTATETSLPTETATPEPTAILPPRTTPDNPTPTKTAG